MPEIVRTRESRYRDGYSSDDERSSSYGRSRTSGGGYKTVKTYRATPLAAEDIDDDRRSLRSDRLDISARHHHLEVDRRVESALAPAPIVIPREEPGYGVIQRKEIIENREVASPRRREAEDYYYRRDVRELEPRDAEVAQYERREIRLRDSVSDDGYSDSSEVIVRRERRLVRSRSRSPRHKLHLAGGALAGAGAAAILANHREKMGTGGEHRGRKVAGRAVLDVLGAEPVTRTRSRIRDRSRDQSRSRSSSRGGNHTKLKTGPDLTATALAAAAAGKYISNRNERKEELARRRSRTRSVSRCRYSGSEEGYSKHIDPKHRTATIAKAGAGATALAGAVEHFHSRSRSRSKSRLRRSGVVAATGLAGAAVASLYEARKAKQDAVKLTPEDAQMLVNLKETTSLTWKQITGFFPGRSSRTLKAIYYKLYYKGEAERASWESRESRSVSQSDRATSPQLVVTSHHAPADQNFSDADSIVSLASLPSLTSGSTASSDESIYTRSEAEELMSLLLNDVQLKTLFDDAFKLISAEKLGRNLARLIRQYSHDLMVEAESPLHKQAAHFLWQKSRNIAFCIKEAYDPIEQHLVLPSKDTESAGLELLDRYLREYQPPIGHQLEEEEKNGDADSDAGDNDFNLSPHIKALRAFLTEGRAIENLRIRFRDFLYSKKEAAVRVNEQSSFPKVDHETGLELCQSPQDSDGLTADYNADQLELARQLREILGVSEESWGNEKKREFLIQSGTEEDILETLSDRGTEETDLAIPEKATAIHSVILSPAPAQVEAQPFSEQEKKLEAMVLSASGAELTKLVTEDTAADFGSLRTDPENLLTVKTQVSANAAPEDSHALTHDQTASLAARLSICAYLAILSFMHSVGEHLNGTKTLDVTQKRLKWTCVSVLTAFHMFFTG